LLYSCCIFQLHCITPRLFILKGWNFSCSIGEEKAVKWSLRNVQKWLVCLEGHIYVFMLVVCTVYSMSCIVQLKIYTYYFITQLQYCLNIPFTCIVPCCNFMRCNFSHWWVTTHWTFKTVISLCFKMGDKTSLSDQVTYTSLWLCLP